VGRELYRCKIEVDTPVPRLRYGYFTLPILWDNALIGRIDPKAHRKEGVFEVKVLHLGPGVVSDDALVIRPASLRGMAQDTAGRRPRSSQLI